MALKSMVGLSDPHLVEMTPRTMAVVMTSGDPDLVASSAIGSLYSSVEALRAQQPFDLEPLRVRWPEQPDTPRAKWVAMWGLPIPDGTTNMPQTDPGHPVSVEVWEYGVVAEVLHEGSHADEKRTLERLFAYADEKGLSLRGPHEEEYMTPPEAAVPRTLIRLRVSD